LLDEKVLSKEPRAKSQGPHIKEGSFGARHYGYGWSIGKTPRGTKVIEHNGSNMIFYADFRRFVDEGVVLMFATNAFEPRSMAIPNRLCQLIFSAVEDRKRYDDKLER
jgi:hypothetical protein